MSLSSLSSGFLLVLSFSRSALRINVDSASLILQAYIGGSTRDFNLLHRKDWCFRFSVSYKKVAFMVLRIGKVVSKLFRLHFALWRGGRPNHLVEFHRCQVCQEEEWTVVSSRKNKSYADAT